MITEILDFIAYNFIDRENLKISLLDIILLIFTFFTTSWVLKMIRKIITKKLSEEDSKRFISVFQVVKYVIYVFVIAVTLNAVGVNTDVFLTASAAFFVGIGFALQTFFQDIFSGILIILDQSLHVGDIIEVDGKVGVVKQIKLRTTNVVTRNDLVMVIPNHKFTTEILFNWTQNNSTNREQVIVGVAYGSDVRLVEKLLIEAVESVEGIVKKDIINVTFDDFADSSLNFTVHFYVYNGMKSPVIKSEIRFKINDLFKQNKVLIPFPQREIKMLN